MTKLKILYFDVETAPLLAYIWSPFDEYVPHDRLVHDSFLLTWAAKWAGERTMYTGVLTQREAVAQDDLRIVDTLADMVRSADIVVAHNIDRFDMPVLNSRLLQQGLEPLGPIQTIDTLKLSKKNFRLAFNKLDHLGEYLGLGRKIKTDFDLWKNCYHGNPAALKKMSTYNQQDVRLLEKVFDHMKPYVRQLTRLTDVDISGGVQCPWCGNKNLVRRGFYRTQSGNFPKYQCGDAQCARYVRGRKAEKVGKVYPL